MISHDIILTFAGGLTAALALGFAACRIGMSPIVGYLLAGIVVGPHTPGFVASQPIAEQFAELGVILLMFGVGLRFHLDELLAVWKVAVPGALIQSLASTGMAAVALHLMGWSWSAGLVVGMAVSVASTVVLVRVLSDQRDLHTPIGHIAVGWVVVEDLLTIALLVLLPLLAGGGPDNGSTGWVMFIALAKLIACVVLVVVGGKRVIPWILDHLARTRTPDLFTLGVLALAVGIAVGAAYGFGVSMALGAFLAGLVVGRSEFAARAAGEAMPMRDAFAVLFFVSVGLLFDPRHLLAHPLLILAVLAVVVVGKPLAALVVVRASGHPWAVALPVGATLGQIGEFTFILGTLGKSLGLIDDVAWNTLIAVAMFSIALNPFLYHWSRALVPQPTLPSPVETPSPDDASSDHASPKHTEPAPCLVVGYGPVGRHVVQALTQRGVPVTVIDLNIATVRHLRDANIPALHGDATRLDTLLDAGLDRAAALIISSDMPDPQEVVRLARARRPTLRVLARCAHLRDIATLRQVGAEAVVAGEGEIAITLTAAVLAAAGADDDTIARTRAEVREALMA